MKLERRRFLTQSLLVGLGTATGVFASPAKASWVRECGGNPSPADALDIYRPLISNLESEILVGLLDRVIEASVTCSKLLWDLRIKVDLLEKEVARSKKKQIQNVSSIIGVGQDEVKFTKVSADRYINTGTLAMVNEQIKEKMADLLPPGENTLSPAAAKLVNEIVALVKASTGAQKNITEEQQKTIDEKTALNTNIMAIRVAVKKATKAIDIATNSKTIPADVSSAKSEAQNQLGSAVDVLEKNLAPIVASKKGAVETFKTLVLALKCIKEWVIRLEEFSNLEIVPNNQTSLFIQTKMEKGTNSLRVPEEMSALGKVIEDNCGRGSALQIEKVVCGYLLVVIAGVKVHLIANTTEGKKDSFLGLLRGTMITNPVCDPDKAREKLASALTGFV